MRHLALLLALALSGCTTASAASSTRSGPVPEGARRLVLVTSSGWDATSGTLRRYERAEGAPQGRFAEWRPVGEAIPVNLGRSGLAWGRGLHGVGAPAGQTGPLKHEGDGRGTAGAYRLGRLFGYEAAPPGARAPFTQVDAHWRCVDDAHSASYNAVVDEQAVKKDWTSDEPMRREDEQYRFVVTVEHNAGPAEPGAGSCIFLHSWRSPTSPTAGCISMEQQQLASLIVWLGELGDDLLVVLPEPAYAGLKASWGLP